MRLHRNLVLAVIDSLNYVFNDGLYADKVVETYTQKQQSLIARIEKVVDFLYMPFVKIDSNRQRAFTTASALFLVNGFVMLLRSHTSRVKIEASAMRSLPSMILSTSLIVAFEIPVAL